MASILDSRAAPGFTLIELSIVLVIIGLVVGGVLVGQGLINAARVRHVISEKDQFEQAVFVFRDKYGYLPGDYPQASTMFSGCADNGNNTCNGNGNGIIGDDVTPYDGEGCRFWQHLSLAKLLQNQNFTYVNANSGYCSPSEVPTSAYNSSASWQMTRCEQGAPPNLPNCTDGNNYLELLSGGVYARAMASGQSIVSPPNAQMIDQKIDDGNPITGSVQAGNWIGHGLDTGPYAPQNRYCLFSTSPYANPIDYKSWSYYSGYSGDGNGCIVGFLEKF